MATPVCPRCSSDQIQKVSGVYHAGISTARTHGQKFSYRKDGKGRWVPEVRPYSEQTTHKSRLAELLAPPEKPGSLLGLATFVLVAFLFGCWFLSSYWLNGLLGGLLSNLVGLMLAGFMALCFFPSTWGFEKGVRAEYDMALAKWRTAVQKWGTFYYCQKCDCVCDLETGKTAPVTSLSSLY